MSRQRASSAMPAFPGAQSSSGVSGERASARTIACSRPPPPTTRTLVNAFSPLRGRQRLEGARELLGGYRPEGLAAPGASRAELDGDLGHRLLVGRLDDRDEVVLPERGPLLLDRDPELLDFLVDLLDPGRVVLQRLNALGGQVGEHYECRHGCSPLLWLAPR